MRQQSLQLPSETYVLTHLELYNWGAFGGRHCAEIDIQGTAIIGPTGSGKTTVVDAFMTLLTANPRYNLASTGGHESDRDLISYVRGVAGAGNSTDGGHIARKGKTVTSLAARFSNQGAYLCIGAIFWLDDNSGATADMKRLWIFSQTPDYGMDYWLDVHHQGGARALKQLAKETVGLQVFDSKQAYLARLRTMFEVGENAFTLLNRAAGLKQLNSIDEIFRELVLDDYSAFQRAGEVVNEFNDLKEIRNELETARQQQLSLQPIVGAWQRHGELSSALTQYETLKKLLPRWYAAQGERLWSEEIHRLTLGLGDLEARQQECENQRQSLTSQAAALYERYLQSGGGNLEHLQNQIATQQDLAAIRRRDSEQYQQLARALQFDDGLSAAALTANQQRAEQQWQQLDQQAGRQEQLAFEIGATTQRKAEDLAALRQEHEAILQRPGSNIPLPYQAFRSDMAAALHLEESQLPFVAELLEVRKEESAWRGAIERAIGGHRLRLMVPAGAMDAALAWVNQRHNRLHVRLLEAETSPSAAHFFDDGFARKLNFKAHPYREALKLLLAGIDRHCVASPQRLREVPHAMTAQGLMSGKARYFEKQDQKRLDQDWMTGFDNQDRLANLQRSIEQAQTEWQQASDEQQQARKALETHRQRLQLLQQLQTLQFEQINLPEAEQKLAQLRRQLEILKSDAGVGQAHAQWQEVEKQKLALDERRIRLTEEKGGIQQQLSHARQARDRLLTRSAEKLTEEEQALAQRQLGDEALGLGTLDEVERRQLDRIDNLIGATLGKQQQCEKDLIRQMGLAKQKDTGALAESGTELSDIDDYLARLRVLSDEALPEKQQRFLTYLNQSSDQGVTQLLMDIQNEVNRIEERIASLNQTLQRVDFQPGQYLRLEPRQIAHERLRTLEQAQRHLRSAALKDDLGESHYRALQQLIDILKEASENRKTVGARALLDPRYRLQFSVSVLDRETHALLETRTGSQGGSGGEKEIIASYVLTASLSYALCPDGSSQPLFGTIVLDEAFSKSSQAVAGRIISALSEFGLHPLFVTPNKELRLLRNHTRSAIVVHRKGLQATLASLSWEELDQHARQRN
ncbi:ATP-binding protein [Brenneria tiliae]|uniref:ATP-binding protein n=1 Tax=Brenneria tiliae TaxID=2914984 RepID=UPI0020148F49|nr:ATP-binding protein [Brenneria tiliae]MCL2898185.1 AAA family ATPase [Brenneria tiliae]MCL2902535.1 AAA family ATPase [Brenneria tiliae]